MENKLPYYMMYSVPSFFDEDKISKTDLEYMKSIYPQMAKLILPIIEETCDRLEYEGSLIYDQYPDKFLLRLLSTSAYKEVEKELKKRKQIPEADESKLLREIVEVLLYQEICRRRKDKRRRRKILY